MFTTLTTQALRFALTAAAVLAAGTATADAKPRRVVILDFDGPRALADSGRSAVVSLLGEQYDVVATKRWEDARASAARGAGGPSTWRKAARQSGVDAVIEGWIQDEGRHKVLTVQVRNAATGTEIDSVSVKLTKTGITQANTEQLRTGLDEVLDWVEAGPQPSSKTLPEVTKGEARAMVGATKALDDAPRSDRDRDRDDRDGAGRDDDRRSGRDDRDRDEDRRSARDDRDRDRDDRDDDRDRDRDDRDRDGVTERRIEDKKVAVVDPETQEKNDIIDVFGIGSSDVPVIIGKKAVTPPTPTPRFAIFAGGYYGSRGFEADAEVPENVDAYSARSKGFQVNAAVFPFPRDKQNAGLHGLGFTGQVYHSAGSEVGIDTDETIGNYQINQNGFELAVHYRQPLGMITLDGQVGYGHDNYILASDAPIDVPDVQYSHLHAGGHLDLHVTERASIGFGGKYFYVLDNGDMSSLDWYGPGVASGLSLDANFTVPLPRSLFVRGELNYKRFKTEFDGAGIITEEENVLGAVDATTNGSVNVGIWF